ncbi:cilium assembly protein DZIP1L-like isoform X1 [Symsagittifera roscoffensis]|uniref:cilium assembly protein DZIP1L-like isoform X1 n=1 Tax=Symsagittifera roscoffensis TaxID=84072 RepID=UPI00307C05FA
MSASEVLASPFAPFSRPTGVGSYNQSTNFTAYPQRPQSMNNSHLHNGMPQRAGLKFRRRTEAVNWRLLAGVDIDRITEETDFGSLQQNLLHVTFCNIDSEVDWRYGVDPNLIKLFKLSQLISEYLLHSQEYLTETINFLELKCKKLQQLNDSLGSRCDKQEGEVMELKKEAKKKKQFIKELQAKIAAGAQQYFPCSICEKSFMSDYFLQQHTQRRHPEALKPSPRLEGDTHSDRVGELERELTTLKERLNNTELSLERARNDSFLKEQIELLKTTTLANISEGQVLKNGHQGGGQQEVSSFQEKILLQLSELQTKYAEAQVALANQNSRPQKATNGYNDDEMRELALYQEKLRRLEVENESQRLLLERVQNTSRHEIVQNDISDHSSSRDKRKPKIRSVPQQSTPKAQKSDRHIGRNGDSDEFDGRVSSWRQEHAVESPAAKHPDSRLIMSSAVQNFNEPDFAEVEPVETSTALNTTTVAVSSEVSRQKNPKESTKGSKKAPEVQDFSPKSDLNVGNSKVAAAKKPIDDLVEWYKSTRRPNLASYHDLKKVADGNLASSSGDRKRKKVNFDEQSEESRNEVEIPATFSRSQRLAGALESDPRILANLRPEMENIMAKELKKLGIPEDSDRISSKTLSSKLRILGEQRAQSYKGRDLSRLRAEYSKDIDEIAREKLQKLGKFRPEMKGLTAENMPLDANSSEHTRRSPGAKRVLFDGQKNTNKVVTPQRVSAKTVGSQPESAPNVRPSSAVRPESKTRFKDLISDDLSFSESEREVSSPKRAQTLSVTSSVGKTMTTVPQAAVRKQVAGGGMEVVGSGGDAGGGGVSSRGGVGINRSLSSGSEKFRPQTNGLVNGGASAGIVATSTLLDESEEDSDWDKSIEMANMMPGPSPKPRATNQNASFGSTNGVQAAARNLESKLLARPSSAGKIAGSVDVGMGAGGGAGVRSHHQQGNPNRSGGGGNGGSALGTADSDSSEPFTDDDVSKNNSSAAHAPVSKARDGGSNPVPVMSSTLRTESNNGNASNRTAATLPSHKTPNFSRDKPTVNSSMTATNRGSMVSVTSYDSDLSDFSF